MESSHCLIALVGRNPEWIKRSVFDTKPKNIILIASRDVDKESPEKKRYIDYAEDLRKFILDFYNEVRMEQPSIKIISIEDPRNLSEFFTVLRVVFEYYSDKCREIYINATAGLLSWQLATFYLTLVMNDYRYKFFFYDKEKGTMIIFPSFNLTKVEREILDIIANNYHKPKDILNEYNRRSKKAKKVSLAMISKYLSELKKKNLIEAINKHYRLTDLGRLFYDIDYVRYRVLSILKD